MALAVVKSTQRARVSPADGATTLAITVDNAGALLVLNALVFNGAASTSNAVSDNVDGAWSLAGEAVADANSSGWQYYLPNSTAGAKTVTFDANGAGAADIEFWVTEVTGAATTTPLDGDSGAATGNQGSVGTMSVASAGTLDQNNNIVFAIASHTSGGGITLTTGNIQGSAATLVGENEDNSGGQSGHIQQRIIASNASVTSTVTWGGSGGNFTWGVYQGIYKEAAGGGGGRTTFNTRAHPLGLEHGMGLRMGG